MSKEKTFVVPILLNIRANSYEEAEKQAANYAYHISTNPSDDSGVTAKVETYFEHDNAGQRVLYLHPEGEPKEE